MAGEMNDLAKTELGKAILEGSVKKVKKLIQDKDKLHFEDHKSNNYLHFVCTMYRPYVFNILAASGLNLNAKNRHGNTPLHVTSLAHEACHVPDLMLYGIDPYIKNKGGYRAADLTQDSRWHKYYKAFEPGLRQAIKQYDITRVEELLQCWSSCHIVVDGKEVRHLAAGLGFYDIVALVDKYRFSILAAYSVMESNYWWLEYAISREQDCNVNFLQSVKGRRKVHMLQHAIRLQDLKLVTMLLDGGANVNTPVYVKDTVLAPLYFEGIYLHSQCDKRLTRALLDYKADLTLRDERGRSALAYAIDRRDGKATVELAENLMDRGMNIAMRDNTGCTARDIAVLSRRRDVAQVMDKYVVQLVKDSAIDTLWELAVDGYTEIIFKFQYRDTWIYAAGNDTEDSTKFLEAFVKFQRNVKLMHYYIIHGDLTKMQDILLDEEFPHRLLFYRDKGGRGSLLKALLYQQWEVAEYILIAAPFIILRETDSNDRTALHYAKAAGDKIPKRIIKLLLKNGADKTKKDVFGLIAEKLLSEKPNFIQDERETVFGLETELHCMKKYEDMLTVIRSKHRGLKHFDKILKQVKFPIAEFPNMFDKRDQPLASDFRDILLCAIDNGKEEIAKKLVNIGVDSYRMEKYPEHTEYGEGERLMDSVDRAELLGMHDLADFIRYKRAKIIENIHLYDKSHVLRDLDTI